MVTSKWDTVLGALQAMRHGPRQSLGEMRITELGLASLSDLRPRVSSRMVQISVWGIGRAEEKLWEEIVGALVILITSKEETF